jgi:hypothetical protein
MKYGVNAAAGTGTASTTLTMCYSILFNGVVNYVVFRGCKTDNIDIDISPEEINASQNFLCQSISVPAAAHGLGASTVFPADNATTPQVGTNCNSINWGGVSYDTVSYGYSVSHNIEARRVIGQHTIKYLTTTNRDITLNFTILSYSPTPITDTQGLTARTLFFDTGTATTTFAVAYIENYSNTLSAEANNTWEQTYGGFAVGASLA